MNIENLEQTIGDMTNLMNGILNEEKRLTKELSRLDLKISNYYHLFELCKFPAHIRSQIDKEFDKALIERRNVKMDISKICSLKSHIKNEKIMDAKKICSVSSIKLEKNDVSEKYMQYAKPEYR